METVIKGLAVTGKEDETGGGEVRFRDGFWEGGSQ